MALRPVILLGLTLAAGCASAPGPTVEPVATLSAPAGLTVRAEVHVRDTATARRFVSGVYLLEPDGTFRVAQRASSPPPGPMPDPPAYPPILRRLNPSEVDRIWRLIGPTSLADPNNPERIAPQLAWIPDRTRSVALIDIRDHHGTRRFAIALSGATPGANDARPLLDRLQALAWRAPALTP